MTWQNTEKSLSASEFKEFRDYLQDISGIDLGLNKQYLVSTRLRRVLAEYQCGSFSELTNLIKRPTSIRARQKVIDVMTTNETFWFRDSYPFDYLKTVLLPQVGREKLGRPLRLWSAACSSGQEPYSLSMIVEECLRENFNFRNVDVQIMATDLSSEILDQARSAIYDRLSISRGLSEDRKHAYFQPVDGDCWQARAQLTRRVNFRALNLQDSYAGLGKFDVIFCRNVLIYFSTELRRQILTKLHAALRPGGSLFLGSSESIGEVGDLFEMVNCNPGLMYRARDVRLKALP